MTPPESVTVTVAAVAVAKRSDHLDDWQAMRRGDPVVAGVVRRDPDDRSGAVPANNVG